MTTSIRFLPWQQARAQQWLNDRSRFAHAWLIHGPAGMGQTDFLQAAAASLLCEAPVEGCACGQCHACRWVQAGNHPDLRRVRPDAVALAEGEADEVASGSTRRQPSREIRIEQIRSLLPWFNTASHRGGWRVTLLYPAEAINRVTANALLKILEEPPPGSLFLLATRAPDQLLPTLVSRCRRLALPLPTPEEAAGWLADRGVPDAAQYLAAAGGAPEAALQAFQQDEAAVPAWLTTLMEEGLPGPDAQARLADALAAREPARWVSGLQRFWSDLLFAAFDLPPRYYPGWQAGIASMAARMDHATILRVSQWLQFRRRWENHSLNNKLLADQTAQVLADALGSRRARG